MNPSICKDCAKNPCKWFSKNLEKCAGYREIGAEETPVELDCSNCVKYYTCQDADDVDECPKFEQVKEGDFE